MRLVVQAFESDRRRAGGLLAGGLAYKVFLWLIPLVLFLVSALVWSSISRATTPPTSPVRPA